MHNGWGIFSNIIKYIHLFILPSICTLEYIFIRMSLKKDYFDVCSSYSFFGKDNVDFNMNDISKIN